MKTLRMEKEELLFIQSILQQQQKFPALQKRVLRTLTPLKVASRKSKGLGFQFVVAEMISRITGRPCVQGSDDTEIFSRLSGQSGTDIGLRGEAKKLFPFSVECKNTETFSITAVMEQAKANATPEMPALIFHKNKALAEPVVVMEASTFERLARINTLYLLGELDK